MENIFANADGKEELLGLVNLFISAFMHSGVFFVICFLAGMVYIK
jgi:hypothetical protein